VSLLGLLFLLPRTLFVFLALIETLLLLFFRPLFLLFFGFLFSGFV
jgi:hypothetical protein